MSKDPKRIAFLLALIPIIGKLLSFAAGVPSGSSQPFFILIHLLLLLVGVFFALLWQNNASGFIEDVKEGMKTVGIYSSANAIFLFFYYKFVDVNHFPNRIAAIVEKTNELPAGKSIDEMTATYEQFFTAFNWATISLVSWIIVGLLYTLIFTILHRKVLRKFK